MEAPKATAQHGWLQELVGNWRIETLVPGEPGEQPTTLGGREVVRAVGDLWVVADGTGDMPGGGTGTMVMTLGFDPERGRFVGTWIGSMMNILWHYDGELDASGTVLTLNSEGPFFDEVGGRTKYRDIITKVDDQHRILTGNFLNREGRWEQMMEAHYYRE